MRRSLIIATALVASVLPGAAQAAAPAAVAPAAAVRTLPSGFTRTKMFDLVRPTSIDVMPDRSLLVLEQDGRVRIVTRRGKLLDEPALSIPTICSGGERGLLGVAHDPDFVDNGFVYLYYTRPAPSLPGGCVNRVSRFHMTDRTIELSSQKVLIDKISSVNGNHNGGDLGFGKDGYLYVSVGDAGSDPRGDSGEAGLNDAAQDRSLLNGKILRIRTDGRSPRSNPFTGDGTARCAKRGNTAETPATFCREIYAYGLRNPFRFAFDPEADGNVFFINDVGQSTYEEVNRGALGANYGWSTREGLCAQGETTPCSSAPSGLKDPITAYDHTIGHVVTGGAFVPTGTWPKRFRGGYLFGDAYSGEVWLRRANGSVSYSSPEFDDLGQLVDLQFSTRKGQTVLFYTLTSGEVGRIAYAPAG